MRTFLLLLLAAPMRDVMLVRFSVSCFARWGLMCISSAIVDAAARYRASRKSRRQVGVIGIKNALVWLDEMLFTNNHFSSLPVGMSHLSIEVHPPFLDSHLQSL
jgi:hypothetical protein